MPSFEAPFFNVGSVNGQNGWGFAGNSPTLGNVVAAPLGTPGFLGTQSLELVSTTNSALFGVANGVYSWRDTGAAAGESSTGATSNSWTTSFYYRTPDVFTNPTAGDTLIAFNPAFRPTDSDVANRYAFFGVTCSNVDVSFNCLSSNTQYRFLLSDYSPTGDYVAVDNISAGTWYRIEYILTLVDGAGTGIEGNDIFTANIYDVAGLLLGSSGPRGTWEGPWQAGTFGGGTGPRVINSMDFLRRQGPTGVSLGFIDNLASLNEIPEPSTFILGAAALTLIAGLRRRNR